jgi:hypothetical protein
MGWRWIVVPAVAAGLAGCGSSPQLSASTADALHKDVAAARTAAQNHDPDAAVAALSDLEKKIDTAEQDGELSADAAAALKRGAARARRRAAREIAPLQPEATATATATATPVPTATPPRQPKPKPKPHPPGKGKGHGKKDKGGEE